jgi:Flp pilus assembly protein TadD
MAGDPVSPASGAETDFLYCVTCGIKTRLQHQRCPRCRGELARRNVYDIVAASCRAQEDRQLRREVRLPVVVGIVAVTAGAIGIAYGLSRGASQPAFEPVTLGRPVHQRPVRADPPPAPDAAELDPAAAEQEDAAALRAGDLERALATYTETLARYPDDLTALNNSGQILVRLDRPAEAIVLLERVVAIAPQTWMAQFNLARALGETGRWSRAADHYQAASMLLPGHYPTLFNLGLALRRAGRDEGAVAALQGAAHAAPDEPDTWLALGLSYERLARTDAAQTAFRRYLALKPNAPQRASIEQRISRGLP